MVLADLHICAKFIEYTMFTVLIGTSITFACWSVAFRNALPASQASLQLKLHVFRQVGQAAVGWRGTLAGMLSSHIQQHRGLSWLILTRDILLA